LRLHRFCVLTTWLAAEDYPVLLSCADLGICLHVSTSGLDLPMKVLDYFGSGVPVCAVNYKCIDELVKHGKNGMVFSDSPSLAGQLSGLLRGFPNSKPLPELRAGVVGGMRWEENWLKNALPVVTSALETSNTPLLHLPCVVVVVPLLMVMALLMG